MKTLYQKCLIEASAFDTGGTNYDISEMVSGVMVQKDYIEKSFPLFVFDLRTTEEVRDFLRDDATWISVTIHMYDVSTESNSETADEEDPTITDTIYSGTIRLYDKPYSTTAASYDEDTEDEDSDNQSTAAPFVYYRVSGIPEDLIDKNSGAINQIYSNAKFDDILINMLSGDDREIYIQPSDNQETKETVLIPPLTLIQAIKYLNDGYQIYNGACSVFLDLNCTYVYNPYEDNMDYTNLFECEVLSSSATLNNEEYLYPTMEDDHVNISFRTLPGFTDEHEIIGNTIGSETVYYSYNELYGITTRSASNSEAYEKKKYFWNEFGQKRFEDAYSESISKSSKAMMMTLTNINPELVHPTTKFVVTADDYPDAEGTYFPTTVSYSITSSDMKHYNPMVSVNLIKKS